MLFDIGEKYFFSKVFLRVIITLVIFLIFLVMVQIYFLTINHFFKILDWFELIFFDCSFFQTLFSIICFV